MYERFLRRRYSVKDAQVGTDIGIPQRIHIVKEAQISDSNEVQLVRCRRIPHSRGKRTFDAAGSPVAANLYGGRNGIQLA